MEVVAAPAPDAEGVTPDTGSTSRNHPWLATVLAVLCVLALAGAVALVWWLDGETDDRTRLESDRTAVIEAAETFTETWNTFRPKEVESYIESIAPLLSQKFRTEFEDASADVARGVVQQRLFSKGAVLKDGDGVPLIGIASLDGDSAEVLVVADATRVANRQRVLRHWRWQVSLVKVDGEWLVDNFEEV